MSSTTACMCKAHHFLLINSVHSYLKVSRHGPSAASNFSGFTVLTLIKFCTATTSSLQNNHLNVGTYRNCTDGPQ